MPALMMICPRCHNRMRPCDKCGSTGKISNIRLSENFYLEELLQSPKATELLIANDPTPTQLQRLQESTVNCFQPFRELVGPVVVTSGFRSQGLNAALKGAKNSAHMGPWAMDAQPQKMTLEEAMHCLYRSPLKFDQAILEMGKHHDRTNDDWLHIAWRHPDTRVQRRQFLVMRDGIYSPWKPTV